VEPEGKSAKAGPGRAVGPRVIFASETVAAEPQPQEEPEPPQAEPTPDEPSPVEPPATESGPQPDGKPAANSEPQPAAEPAPIIVAPGPGGIMIASEDIEALDAFEDLITALASGPMAGTADLTVFYLVHAKAPSVAQTLDLILGGGTLADETGSPAGSMLGDLAGAAFGEAGGLVGSLLGLGGGGTIAPSGSVQIIPDSRLNALVVRANPTDTDTIRQLLEVLDQPESPEEILAQPKARSIRLYNMQADEVAEIVKQVYQERMGSGSGGGGGRQPSPQEFIEAAMRARGGRGGGRSGGSTAEELPKMSLGVDARTNSLIVYAPESLFQEVKEFVEGLDEAAMGSSNQAVEIVSLKRSNAEAVQKALQTLVGESVSFGGSGGRSQRPGSTGQPGQPGPPPPGSGFEDMQRRMEFFRALQQRSGGSGSPFSGRSRPSFGDGRPSPSTDGFRPPGR
ncbi:MAG: secretin N-terminal domain-containing protein, partial [Planctomycetota bacterium]